MEMASAASTVFFDKELDTDALADGNYDWFTKSQLQHRLGENDTICHAVETWHQSGIIRGKGKACNQMQEQFA